VFWDNAIVTRDENNKMEANDYNDAGHFLAFPYELNCDGEIPHWKDDYIYTKEIDLKVNAVNIWLETNKEQLGNLPEQVWVTNWKRDYETYKNHEKFETPDRFVQFVRLRWARLYEINAKETNPRAFKRFRDFAINPLSNSEFTPYPSK
jgi:hypothetical protein